MQACFLWSNYSVKPVPMQRVINICSRTRLQPLNNCNCSIKSLSGVSNTQSASWLNAVKTNSSCTGVFML